MADQCWIIRRPGENDESANERHYTEQQAREEASRVAAAGGTVAVEPVTAPCITLTCLGCGYQVDEDDDGVIHFESIRQAHEYVVGSGDEVVFAGGLLVRCGIDCPGPEGGGDRG
ncbi:hypothetical protein [Spirillospora sp. NBC_01491]|uniref:hypothetical protein n=1 Tax=Spirillospora sp. NBC_01491 TaxID=2976007 RepID=UPI002E33CE01|nr:hypothetical protein [Spirillospora sp. NBC_01491]